METSSGMAAAVVVEGYLKAIANHTEPRPSYFITVSNEGSTIATSFSPPLTFLPGCNYEMALCSLETYYSFPNIDKTNNALKVSRDNGKKWTLIEIPTGCYEIKAINKTLQRLIKRKITDAKEDDVKLAPNENTLQCILTLKDNIQVDFNIENSLRSVLGFEARVYTRGRHESEHIVNILRVNSIFVHCDVVKSSRKNGIESPLIDTFFPNVSPGEKIVHRPKNLIYLQLTLDIISQMTVWLTDQNDTPLDLRGEELTITFHIKAC